MRFWLLKLLIRFIHWSDWFLENTPHHKQRKPIMFDPLTVTILTSIAISAASFGAQLLITSLLTPRKKQEVRGKLTGDITVSDSVFGAPIYRIYGGRPPGSSAGGVEVGGNFFFASEIRKLQTNVPSGSGGGGGKGGKKAPPTVQIEYKIDVAAAVGAGPLRLLRLKFNEDIVYNALTASNQNYEVLTYEAERTANVLTGGAVVADDNDCSGAKKVSGIGGTGKLVFKNIGYGLNGEARPQSRSLSRSASSAESPSDPPDPVITIPYIRLEVFYKSAGEKFAYVKIAGDGGVYSFPDTAGGLGSREILREYTGELRDVEFSYPDGAANSAPEIDRLTWTIIYLEDFSVTGVYNENLPPELPQHNYYLPDPRVRDTNPRERYNGSPTYENDGIFYATLTGGGELAWYPGTEDQPVDAVIAAQVDSQYGAGSTPAFRGTAFARIKDLNFTAYGALPNLRFVVENMTTRTVSEICLAEALAVGLTGDDLDLTAADGKFIRGYYVGGTEAPSKIFEDLATIHNLSFTETSDGQIVCRDLTARQAVAAITDDDLGAYVEDGGTAPPADLITSTIPDPSVDEIRTLELQFNNPLAPSDYATDRQSYTFPYTPSVRTETTQINATLLPDEAFQIIRRQLQKHHLKSVPDAFVLPHKYADLNAADCVEIEIEGEMKLRRIEQKTGSAPGIYEIAASSEDVFFVSDSDEVPFDNTGTVTVPANTVGTIMDLPSLSDAEGLTSGVYIACCSKDIKSGAWTGATAYRYKGTAYEPMVSFGKQALIGVLLNTMSDVPTGWTAAVEDTQNVVTVDFYGDEVPTTVSEAQITDGANRFVAGSEVVAVRTWTRDNNYPNRWTGTNLKRRLFGSVSNGHAAGERCVFLDDAVKFVTIDESERGIERDWKFVTNGQRIEDAAVIVFYYEGANKEILIPRIGQLTNATNTQIEIAVNNYTTDARFRRIEVAAVNTFENAIIVSEYASNSPNHQLKSSFLVTRSTNLTTAETRFVRVAHSSNNIGFTAPSNVLSFTFADSGGGGGSGGGDDGSGGGGGGGGCFTAPMFVPFADGKFLLFGEIAARRDELIGAEIKSFDDDGNIRTDFIEEIFIHTVSEIIALEFADGTRLETTREHPFWTSGREFKPVGDLRIGGVVMSHATGWRSAVITSIEQIDTDGGIEVYNLRTRLYQHYFVTDTPERAPKAVHNLKMVPVDDFN